VAASPSSGPGGRKAAGDLVFAFVHLAALLAALGYAVYSLVRGNVPRFGVIVILLAIYYAAVLHPAVVKEVRRRRALKP
jgi:hypothetical protein